MNFYILHACRKHVAEAGEEHQRKLRRPMFTAIAGFSVLVMGMDAFFGYNESLYLATTASALIPSLWFAYRLYVVLRDTNFRDRFDENGNFQ